MNHMPAWARPTQMVFRLAFVLALLLGLDHWWSAAPAPWILGAHIGTGILLLITLWMLAAAWSTRILWAAAILGTVAAAVAVMAGSHNGGWAIVHLVLMIAVVGMAEAGASRAKRSLSPP